MELHKKYDGSNVEIQTDFSANSPVLEADILITDWSDISFEYAFTTKRPVIFINTPMKVMNEDYKKIKTVPVNIAIRDKIGKSIDLDKLETINEIASDFIANRDKYKEQIEKVRSEEIYNIGKSRIMYGKYVI